MNCQQHNIHRGRRFFGVVLLLLSVSIAAVLVRAQDATLELSKDVPTFVKMTAKGLWEWEPLTQYGNWYGPDHWGGSNDKTSPGNKQPVDELDAVAMRHDFAYQIAEEQGKIHGKAEEQRLKAYADAIAVMEAKGLPKDPRDWDPPAADPEKAGRYRDRIGFGFVYYGGYNYAKSELYGTYEKVLEAFGKKPTTGSGILPFGPGGLDEMAAKRAEAWFKGKSVRPMYRFDLSAPKTLIAEWEKVSITGQLVPVEHKVPVSGLGDMVIVADLKVSGPGELSATKLSPGVPIVLTATRRWYGLRSSNGYTITVTASNKAETFDVLESVIRFTVAAKTVMQLSAEPQAVNEWPIDPLGASPCVDVTLRAKLTDLDNKGIEGISVELKKDDGTTYDATTGPGGVATWTVQLCDSEIGDEWSKTVGFSVRMKSTTASDGTVYILDSASTNVVLTKEETKVIGGQVRDELHGYLLKGASVQIDGPNGSETGKTDSSGWFHVTVPEGSGYRPTLTATVSMKGYESATFTATTEGRSYNVSLQPLEATVTGRVIDAEKKGLLDGSTVKVTQPFDSLIFTEGGRFTITGLYVGDTLTMTADAFNHKAYTKSGKITLESASITFSLPPGKGTASGGLEETETEVKDLPRIHSLMVWASPADPASYQDVIVTAQIFPPEAGILIEISMHGTDKYATSTTAMTNAMGKVFLHIPGADPGVLDDIIVRIVNEGIKRHLKYSF